MIAFPGMIAKAAEQAGMTVPVDPDEEFNADEFPHFHVYCNVQLGVPVTWGNHWENAKIIAAIPVENIKKVTYTELVEKGFSP